MSESKISSCPKCGTQFDPNGDFCPGCGAKTDELGFPGPSSEVSRKPPSEAVREAKHPDSPDPGASDEDSGTEQADKADSEGQADRENEEGDSGATDLPSVRPGQQRDSSPPDFGVNENNAGALFFLMMWVFLLVTFFTIFNG